MAMTGGTAKLVKTGYADYGDTSLPIRLYVYYKSTQDIATNKSTIYVGMYVTTPSSSYAIGKWDDFNGSYVGKTSLTFNGTVPANTKGTYWLVENKSFTVNHDDNGKGSATIYWKWGVNSPWGQMVNPSGSFNITLPTIPRASVPTVSSSSVTMGNSVTIYTNRKSTSFSHNLRLFINGYEEDLKYGVGDSYVWNVPTSLAAKITNKTQANATIRCRTFYGENNYEDRTVNLTIKVPSATSPTLPTSTESNPVYAGSGITIGLPRKADNFTHKLTYSFANTSGNIGSYATSAPWTIPYSLCSQMPTKWYGTIAIQCVTYNGTAEVGTVVKSLYFRVPDNSITKPKIENISIVPVNSLKSPFDALYIQGLSKVKATYTTSLPYSYLKNVTMTVQSKTVTSTVNNAVSGYLNSGTNVKVSFVITNARGQTNTGSATIPQVYEYNEPLVAPLTGEVKALCYRSDSVGKADTSGLNLTIKAQRKYWEIGGNNTCTLWYRLKVYDGLPFADNATKTTLLKSTVAGGYDSVVSGVSLSAASSYTIEVGVTDTMGNSSSIVYFIPTASATFHLAKGGKGASFGGYSDGDGLLVPWKARFTGSVQGNAYGLGRLKVIGEDDESDGNDDTIYDANDFTTPGVYSIKSNDFAEERMINLPYLNAGKLIVSSGDGLGKTNGEWANILQEYISFDGRYRASRLVYTQNVADKWYYYDWERVSSTDWKDLGLSSNVSSSSYTYGRTTYGCAYRVVNEKHVHVAFNCKFNYAGGGILVNNTEIPQKYRPKRTVFALCAMAGRNIARVFVNPSGNVFIEWIQEIPSSTSTTSFQAEWIDGYIDYWI